MVTRSPTLEFSKYFSVKKCFSLLPWRIRRLVLVFVGNSEPDCHALQQSENSCQHSCLNIKMRTSDFRTFWLKSNTEYNAFYSIISIMLHFPIPFPSFPTLQVAHITKGTGHHRQPCFPMQQSMAEQTSTHRSCTWTSKNRMIPTKTQAVW